MKKIIFCFFILSFSIPRLISQTTVEEMFAISFDVNYETAKLYRNKIITMAPGSMYAMYCESWFMIKSDSLNHALTISSKLIEKYPDFVYGYLAKGNVYYFMGKYTDAIKNYNKVVEMNPKENGGYLNRAECKYYLEDYRGAVEDYDKVLSANPKPTDADYFSEAYYFRGLAKIKLGQTNEGCLNLSKAGEMGYTKAYEDIKKLCK